MREGLLYTQAIVHSQACDETGAGSLLMIGILRVTATYCSPTRIAWTIGGPGINADNIWVYIKLADVELTLPKLLFGTNPTLITKQQLESAKFFSTFFCTKCPYMITKFAQNDFFKPRLQDLLFCPYCNLFLVLV